MAKIQNLRNGVKKATLLLTDKVRTYKGKDYREVSGTVSIANKDYKIKINPEFWQGQNKRGDDISGHWCEVIGPFSKQSRPKTL